MKLRKFLHFCIPSKATRTQLFQRIWFVFVVCGFEKYFCFREKIWPSVYFKTQIYPPKNYSMAPPVLSEFDERDIVYIFAFPEVFAGKQPVNLASTWQAFSTDIRRWVTVFVNVLAITQLLTLCKRAVLGWIREWAW